MPTPSLLRTALVLLLSTGCTSVSSARVEPASVQVASVPQWRSPLHTDHPLVGKLWDVERGRMVEEAELRGALTGGRYVLLGEQHDNPDHHLLQAALVCAVAEGGRRPVLAFEMLDVAQQPQVDEALARAPRDADALALAVDWAHSGWPDWSLYRPVFAAGLERGLPVVGANLPRTQVRALVMKGSEALDAGLRARLGLDTPLPEDVAQAMREEMRESHCGHLPENMMEPMVLAQRARDAHMAERMLATDTGGGAILIAGAGHARSDRGVPTYLTKQAADRRVLSVGFVEVAPDVREPQGYAAFFGAGRLPFDYVWFTPAARREDPCAALRKK
jgi:uncharacterized iron-regulated protein